MNGTMTFRNKFSRLSARLHAPEWRQYGALLLAGKLAGIGILLLGAMLINPGLMTLRTFAAEPNLKVTDVINPLNTVWTLIAAFLVFGMQVGFTMLEAGFCRSRETVNVLMECIVDTCLCGLLFFAFGFAFMFSHGNGFIGYHWFFLQDAPGANATTSFSDSFTTQAVTFSLVIFHPSTRLRRKTTSSGARNGNCATSPASTHWPSLRARGGNSR